jgi:hypothetical protein
MLKVLKKNLRKKLDDQPISTSPMILSCEEKAVLSLLRQAGMH